MGYQHQTVLLKETVELISPCLGGVYADVTSGGGGHSEAILQMSAPTGKLIALDRDPEAVAVSRERLSEFGDRVMVVHGDFSDIEAILKRLGIEILNGIVADLGVSSAQIDNRERGFSFVTSGPLDMRMDRSQGRTVAELIAGIGETELADLIYGFGQERRSRAIARSIKRSVREGRMSTTSDLRAAIIRTLRPGKRGKIDPCTRTFQALRIAVNNELEQLHSLMSQLADLLADGGVAAIISFHSLEDRIVKQTFRRQKQFEILTKKPIAPSVEERKRNPRSRSAKLRAARRITRKDILQEASS